MRKGFTIVEVSILFVIFLIVAFLVAPLSLDDTAQTKNEIRWKDVQSEFSNIIYAINIKSDLENFNFTNSLISALQKETKNAIEPYKITYRDGTFPSVTYRFSEYGLTYQNAIIAYKIFAEPQDDVIGILMYDVNGQTKPNQWGRDVFGYNIYKDRLEPFCKDIPVADQKQDCSKNGRGLCCSNYYLIGGSLN